MSGGGGGGGAGGGGSGSKDRSRERERDRSRRGDRPSRFGPRSSSHSRERERERDRDRGGKKSAAERRVFVSNIAYEYHWQELKDLFRKEGMFFIHVLLMLGPVCDDCKKCTLKRDFKNIIN